MALGKRSGVTRDVNPQPGPGRRGAGQDGVIGDDSDSKIAFGTGGPPLKKFGQHQGAAPHAGEVMHSGERLQGNVGDHPHYADQPDSQ